jgi:hypothetical protein
LDDTGSTHRETSSDPDLAAALTSVRRIVDADPRDWTANRHDAFIYGVFRGWGDQHDEELVAAKHGWDAAFVTRLHRLGKAVELYLLHSSS